jgi:hypothetical protein
MQTDKYRNRGSASRTIAMASTCTGIEVCKFTFYQPLNTLAARAALTLPIHYLPIRF